MTQERFAQLTGLTEGQVRGMIEKGHLPSLKIGKPRMVNIAALSQDAMDKEDWQ
ncbi:helix-turn-helix domain-containing protein [Marinobacter qingdaonensis]|uniref:Helix-turn-helix domain-containing protein n=2 Tax=Marinobacter TaxID=2742 RepID=A0ABU5NYH0_9GAMM|nr:helix-turn-helix domain-containing protein [Marinobacter sp. ASW11-75]MEA1080762.1 helix-turn-helix domain-containing protein [Marinobacter sp. ASW11-75]